MLKKIFDAIRAGNELKNPAAWKRGQHLTNLVTAVVVAGVMAVRHFFPAIPLPDGVEDTLVEVIVSIALALNLYLVPATTRKIGFGG